MAKKEKSYQEALSELEKLVAEIENPQRSLTEISEDVKKAVELVSQCRELLRKSEENLNNITKFTD